jgi:hypothetical protein
MKIVFWPNKCILFSYIYIYIPLTYEFRSLAPRGPVTFLSLSSPPVKPNERVDPSLKLEKDHLKNIIQVLWR